MFSVLFLSEFLCGLVVLVGKDMDVLAIMINNGVMKAHVRFSAQALMKIHLFH